MEEIFSENVVKVGILKGISGRDSDGKKTNDVKNSPFELKLYLNYYYLRYNLWKTYNHLFQIIIPTNNML